MSMEIVDRALWTGLTLRKALGGTPNDLKLTAIAPIPVEKINIQFLLLIMNDQDFLVFEQTLKNVSKYFLVS